jgi:Ca-activated chloride channel family protein
VNEIRAHSIVATGGAVDLSGAVRAEGLGEVRFAQAVNLRRPRALWISDDPADSTVHLLKTLEAGRFEVVRSGDWKREKWESFELLMFNNWDIESLSLSDKKRLEAYVKQGGGVLVIGGERNTYVEKKGDEDALDRLLPAKIAPPRSPEGTCVVLIVDKSSSMEGKKIELARLAAIGVVQNLRPIDSVGVLIFDNSFQWAVPIRHAEDRSLIVRLISGITPDGGTQIAPALAEAYRRVQPVKATFKHLVLLTDGISEEGDSMNLARDAEAHRVTISTVGLGQDVNRAYLEKVAVSAKGKAYFLTDPVGLEQILLRDVMEHTGSTVVEKPFRPIVAGKTEILDGVDVERAPALKGYVRYVAKPTAETILSVDRKDPLLVRWQYGLGRVAVFTSDAKNRWAADWVGWRGFDKFWSNLTRDLLPHAQAGEAVAAFDSANDELVVDYRLNRYVEEPAKIPDIFVSGPDGFMQPVPVAKLAHGAYRGRVSIGKRQGLFRVRPLEESRAFPEVGMLRQEREVGEYGSNPALLENVARFTGGRVNPDPGKIFDAAGRALASSLRLWPALLVLAILCNLAELALRKLRGSIAASAAR